MFSLIACEKGPEGPVKFAELQTEVPQIYLGSGYPLELKLKAFNGDSQQLKSSGWEFFADQEIVSQYFMPKNPGNYEVWAQNGDIRSNSVYINALAAKNYDPVTFQIIIHFVNIDNLDFKDVDEVTQHLNDGFSNNLNSVNPNAQSANIHFELVETDSNGVALIHPGVVFEEGIPDTISLRDLQKIKRVRQWNPDRYINVWVADVHPNAWSNFGALDCDQNLPGLRCMGENQTHPLVAVNLQKYHISKKSDTFIHEMGHHFGLLHPFYWNCDLDSDYCVDTPKYIHDEKYNAPPSWSCDGQHFIQDNHMDYTDGPSFTFTYQQVERMRHVVQYGRYVGNKRGLKYRY